MLEAKHGVQDADSLINSGQPFPVLEQTSKILSAKGEKHLNTREAFFRDALNEHLEGLKNGNFLEIVSKTPAGGKINRDFIDRQSAIDKNPMLSPEQKQIQSMENKDRAVSERVSLAHAMHIPDKYVNPIPKADIAIVQNSFETVGGDPNVIRSTLNSYSPQNQAYLAKAMKTPAQQYIVDVMANTSKIVTPADQDNFVYANQPRHFQQLKSMTDDDADKRLKLQVATQLDPQIRMINSLYPATEAQQKINALINTTVNTAKFMAGKNINYKEGEFYNHFYL